MAIETFPTPITDGIQIGDPFETSDGRTYIWNGFAWELECSGGGAGGDCNFNDKQCEALKKLVSPYVDWTKYFHFIGYEMGVYANQVRVEWNSNTEDIFQDELVGWEIDLDGNGTWKDIADLTTQETALSGFMGTTGTKIVFTTPGGGTQYEPNTTYPCLQVRLTVRNYDGDGFEAVETTPPLFVFVDAPHTDETNPAPQPSACTI